MFSKDKFDVILSMLETITIDEEYFRLPEVEINREEEALLIHRALMGEDEAFTDLVRIHHKMVFNLGYRFLNSAEEAEELTQEVFLRVYRFLPRFKKESSLKTWIYRITVNSALNRQQWLKRRKSEKHVSLNQKNNDDERELQDIIPDESPSPENSTINTELQNKIQECLSKVPKKLRIAVILRDIEGLSYEEIAVALGINDGTVKSRIARGRSALRDYLSDYIEVRNDN
ncbi:MAG: sigma-70 family RNA polymerase sigma factor [Acidobacteria bacterium]|nr:sigma-70 family RNA polymerase sigma factor [Acidobacteriota bacterium]